MKKFDHLKGTQLYKAVRMALYLIIDIKRPLKFALSCSSEKHKVKPIKRIEDLVRIALPDDFFEKRQRANAPKEKREEAAVRHKALERWTSLLKTTSMT
ncbi:hypothetical protein [Pseudoalteromonas ruthenica]|nr:hypothetical protein [Pseudoalteromonas ruthenica]